MSVITTSSPHCRLGVARPARAIVVGAVSLTAVGFLVTLFSAISACPVNLAGGLLMVGASRPLLDSAHVHRAPRRRLHHQPCWYALATVMTVAGFVLSAQSA